MGQLSRTVFAVVLGIVCFWPSNLKAGFAPSGGDLYYNGYFYLDSYFEWSAVGPFASSEPGYEHDLSVSPDYFRYCTSWTNLLAAYDDCPTAGILEPRISLWTFSFGTFRANSIIPYPYLWFGSWSFGGGSLNSTPYRLNGQEVTSAFCTPGVLSIWCMNGVRSQLLSAGDLNFVGRPGLVRWGSW